MECGVNCLNKASISHFESLGDNCEFGFLQRMNGIEAGGLLRWAISRPDALTKFINSGGENLYAFENLQPSASDMVLDVGSDLFFHTEMYSKDGVFLSDEGTRFTIWQGEYQKMEYLREKLFQQLRNEEKIYVYKVNDGLNDTKAISLARAISNIGRGRLLCVRNQGDLAVGEVIHHSENLYFAEIDRFAPYDKADDVSFDVWNEILENALTMVVSS